MRASGGLRCACPPYNSVRVSGPSLVYQPVTIGLHTIAVLFNTAPFLLGFLPLTMAGFFLVL